MQKWADSRNAARKIQNVDTTPREASTGHAVLIAEMRETVEPLRHAVRRSRTRASTEAQSIMRQRRMVAASPDAAPAPAPAAPKAQPVPMVAYSGIAPLPNHGAPKWVGSWPDDDHGTATC